VQFSQYPKYISWKIANPAKIDWDQTQPSSLNAGIDCKEHRLDLKKK
jgi:hypothetical protein